MASDDQLRLIPQEPSKNRNIVMYTITTWMRGLTAVSFVSLLFLAFVGLHPLADRVRRDVEETGEGDIVTQVVTIIVVFFILTPSILKGSRGFLRFFRAIPCPMFLALGWCGITLFWSPVPEIGFRRFMLTSLTVFSIFATVQNLGTQRTLKLLALSLMIFVIVSLISGLIIPNAVHQSGEGDDAALIGAWRGIFIHKNHAGLAAALCIIIGYFLWRSERRWVWWIAIVGGVALLVMSQSKTSLGLLLPALGTGVLFSKCIKSSRGRFLFQFLIVFCAFFIILLAISMNREISGFIDDPTSFTGRSAIWAAIGIVIIDHPIGGIGFGSIYNVGSRTALLGYGYASGWVSQVPHGHNGYLDITASTGFLGLFIAFFVFFIIPFRKIIRVRNLDYQIGSLLIALLTFTAFHNLLETSLLDRTRPLWIILLLVYAISHARVINQKSLEKL